VAVALKAGGICGSDLHYYNHGGFGPIKLREPMVLGHEVAGEIVELGPDVEGAAGWAISSYFAIKALL
jgi:L-idonate 5-dehydrogenase